MDRASFEQLASAAFRSIPERFLSRLGNVVVIVEDLPAGVQNAIGENAEGEADDLLGLYEGTPLVDRFGDPSGLPPDVITLFQQPIEAEAAATDGDTFRAIRETLIHEIGHHFGLDDAEIERIFEERWGSETK